MAGDVVLVVEDDPKVRELLAETLISEGWDVVEAADGAEALLLAEQQRVRDRLCLVMLDMMLPRVDGVFVLRRLERANPQIPIIAISASDSYLKAAAKAGATQVLAKPFGLVDVLDVVDRYGPPPI